ncbi:MAG TPA: KHG/KDPG aldolase/sugar kinase fusion protein [Anaerolineales bacterium]|nr:KHG/KDPG aldolase/sugar kinase fusion protein [Anaerolineales bacterium]
MHEVLERLHELKIIPVVKINDVEKAIPLAQALCLGGLPCAEITFRTAQAEEAIRRIAVAFPEMLVGAGTVLTIEQVDKAVAAGARFIVSPGFNPRVVDHCIALGIPITPGCSSPSDVEQALERGLEVVKFFPAENLGGVSMLKAISGPYGGLKFIPTGGINAKNISEYLAFTKVLACGGSWMVKDELINDSDFDTIEKLTREAVQIVSGKAATQAETFVKAANVPLAGKVVTFGEIMLRLAPLGYYRFVQAETFDATYGGGEANVAVSLANFGLDARYVTKLPIHEIGQAAVDSLRRYGVDTSKIVRGGKRVGIYFLEKGASQRASKVIYDRANSSIAEATTTDFDWANIFDGACWFHFTGITPALGDNVAEICMEACKEAKRRGLTVSCDLNYRKNLWSREKAGTVMARLMPYVDICIANEEDAKDVFGIAADDSDITNGKLSHDGYKEVAKQLADRFGFEKVAITLRGSISANDNRWAGMLYDKGDYYFSKEYTIHIVDRVGGGDSFGGGLIYSLISNKAPQEALEFAVSASCLKHTIEGDFNQISTAEVDKLAAGDATGRVQR